MSIEPSTIYFAPRGYHLLIENERSFALSTDYRVNYARPAIDVLFESASSTFRQHLIGILLTGSNHDGAAGLASIYAAGGTAIVQDPKFSQAADMPRAGVAACPQALTMTATELARFLSRTSRAA